MTDESIKRAKTDIEATSDLLERALKLSGLVTTLFKEHGFSLVVVGGSASFGGLARLQGVAVAGNHAKGAGRWMRRVKPRLQSV